MLAAIIYIIPKQGVGTWEGAVDIDGICKSRQGTTIGICCVEYDEATKKFYQIPCTDAAQAFQEQAIIQVGNGQPLIQPGILYSVRIENEGNTAIQTSIISATTTGPAEGITEFNRAWQTIINQAPKTIQSGESTSFGMHLDDTIRLSVPDFTMPDGTYTTTVIAQGRSGATIIEETATITTRVEQERVGFSITVSQVK